ncbi:hypothetical protein B0H15DRAFT_193695 [Mycena belliarum]|uniref:DRBM domain-containing protein n=1 Tax=Mycena belliarum TaxID=1033014 RepID=A0AAD6UGX9_9AGAR|nr:hypothetical protein B0H15DRAFT_193695 [Mycena belliae]
MTRDLPPHLDIPPGCWTCRNETPVETQLLWRGYLISRVLPASLMYCMAYKSRSQCVHGLINPLTTQAPLPSPISMSELTDHNRTELNNVAARRGQIVAYTDSQTGPLNKAEWTSVVFVNGYEYGRGSGKTKASAREGAARQALRLISQGY